MQRLRDEGLSAARQGLGKLFRHVDTSRTISKRPGSGRQTKLSPEILQIGEDQMQRDDETTAALLEALLTSRGYQISLSTVLRCRRKLGWTFRGSDYCQLIRTAIKEKRLQFARAYAEFGFGHVIVSDETSIQLYRNSPLLLLPRTGTTAEEVYNYV